MEFITTGNRIAVENFDIGKIYTITWETGNYKSLACTGKGTDFVMFQDQEPDLLFCLTMDSAITVSSIDEGGGGAGTMNYNELENKPSINGIVLVGNKTGADLNLVSQADLDDYATNASVVAGLATKQDALSSSQLSAVNSGITSELVTQIGTNTSAIAGKQDALSSSQLSAVNSGIDSTKVAQIETNKNNISLIKQVPTVEAGDNGKVLTAGSSSYSWTTPTITGVKGGQESTYRTGKVSISAANILSTAQQNAVNSGVTSTTVSQVETNTTNISKITPTTTYKTNHAFQSANYELIDDVYIDVPDGKRIFLVVGAKQSNVTGIAVCFNTTTYDATKIVISQEVSAAQQMISCAGCYDNGNGGQSYRMNVFAKGVAGSQLNCRVTLSWWYL